MRGPHADNKYYRNHYYPVVAPRVFLFNFIRLFRVFSRFAAGPVHVAIVQNVRHVVRVVRVFTAQRTGHGRTQVVVRRIVFGQLAVGRHGAAGPQRERDRTQRDFGEAETVPRRTHAVAVRGVPQGFRPAVVAQETHANAHG